MSHTDILSHSRATYNTTRQNRTQAQAGAGAEEGDGGEEEEEEGENWSDMSYRDRYVGNRTDTRRKA